MLASKLNIEEIRFKNCTFFVQDSCLSDDTKTTLDVADISQVTNLPDVSFTFTF